MIAAASLHEKPWTTVRMSGSRNTGVIEPKTSRTSSSRKSRRKSRWSSSEYGKGILDRDRLEERELVGAVIEVIERGRQELAPAGSDEVSPGVRRNREQPTLGPRGVAKVVIGSHSVEERLLDEVLGIRKVAGQAEAVAVQAVEVVASQLRK